MPSHKVCVVCAIDVSNIKRVKDPHGNYYCQVCYDAKLADRRAKSSGDPEVDFECNTCRRFFNVDDVYDESGVIICKACFAARTRPPKPAQPVPSAGSHLGTPSSGSRSGRGDSRLNAPAPAAIVPLDDADAPIPMHEDVLDLVEDEPAPPAITAPAPAAPITRPTQKGPPPAPRRHAAAPDQLDQLEVIPDDPPATTLAVWHVHDHGQSFGPFSAEDLITSAKEGRFSTAANIWKDGLPGWTSILKIESLTGQTI